MTEPRSRTPPSPESGDDEPNAGPVAPPSTTAPKVRSGIRRWIVRIVFCAYVMIATVVCVTAAAFMPRIGGPIAPHLPENAVAFAHLRDGNAVWRALETNAGLLAVWMDPEFQRLTGLKEKRDNARKKLSETPVVRDLVTPDREGLRFLIGGEVAVALYPSESHGTENDGDQKLSGLLFLRLQGARGALIRMAAAFAPRREKAEWHDLGGGLIALGTRADKKGGPPLLPEANAERASVELLFRPRLMKIASFKELRSLGDAVFQAPDWFEVLGAGSRPKQISVRFTAAAGGGLMMRGVWDGALPKTSPAAPLIDPGLPEDARPLIEVRMPIDAQAAFLRHLHAELGSDKKRRRWAVRLARLEEAGVDLDRDLWPAAGHTLRLILAPPVEGSATEQAVVLASMPLRATTEARRALAEFFRVRWRGFYDGRAPGGAKRPHVIRRAMGDTDQYMLVKGSFTRSMWLVVPEAISFISDAVPLGLMPRLAESGLWRAPSDSDAIFSLRSDGDRMAIHVAALTQMHLEDRRDDMGAAEFIERFPDMGAITQLAETISRATGSISVTLRADPGCKTGDRGSIEGWWSGAAE